jgi:hypothetical protein
VASALSDGGEMFEFLFGKKKKSQPSTKKSISTKDSGFTFGSSEHQERVRLLKKEATQLKKTDPLLAAEKIKQAIDLDIANNVVPGLSTELRYPAYLALAGKIDEAMNELARLSHEGPALECSKPNSQYWYSDQGEIIRARMVILSKEKKKQSWVQYVSDSFLAFFYEAMWHIKTSKRPDLQPSIARSAEEHLAFMLKFEQPEDLKAVGWKGFKALGLEHRQDEFLAVMQNWAKSAPRLKVEPLEDWFDQVLKEEGL